MAQLVFYIRNKPQNADAIDLCRETNRSFIGYPVWRKEFVGREHDFRRSLVDISVSDPDWEECVDDDPSYRRQVSTNRNLVRDVESGSITLIPRPDRGLVYAGRVEAFELVDNPPWGQTYLDLRAKQGLEYDPPGYHLADVVQSWRVDRWRPVPFSVVPAWIRRSFFGRSTSGRIYPLSELGLNPFTALDTLIENPRRINRSWTMDVNEVEQRLVADIGPTAFEHLMVALLQYEQPDLVWQHVGGSGDGGVDGLAADSAGHVAALLQCKWRFEGGSAGFDEKADPKITCYVAALIHPAEVATIEKAKFCDRRWVAERIIQHSAKLPWAHSMRIGRPA